MGCGPLCLYWDCRDDSRISADQIQYSESLVLASGGLGLLGGCWHRGSKRCSAFNTFSHSIVLHRRKQAMMKRMIRMLISINNRPTLALGCLQSGDLITPERF